MASQILPCAVAQGWRLRLQGMAAALAHEIGKQCLRRRVAQGDIDLKGL